MLKALPAPKIENYLFSFQKEGVDLMLHLVKTNNSALCFDEMGLGKTIEGIALIQELKKTYGNFLTVVVCPNTLKYNWQKQIQKWTGESASVVGSTLDKFDTIFTNEGKLTAQYIIINYETLRNNEYAEIIKLLKPKVILYDEAHRMRNTSTEQSKGAYEIAKSEPLVICMTGTPIVNTALDLFALLRLSNPKKFKYQSNFEQSFCILEYGRYGPKVVGTKNKEQLQETLSQYAIQRRKSDVLTQLGPKTYQVIPLDMNQKQAEAYIKMRDSLILDVEHSFAESKFTFMSELLKQGRKVNKDTLNGLSDDKLIASGVLAKLIRLRQLTTDPKLVGVNAPSPKTEALFDLIDNEDEKLVIFSTFESYINTIEKELLIRDIKYKRITGKETSYEREQAKDSFQEGDTRIILATLQAGGEGIDLFAAQHVIFIDRWWSPALNLQSEDRLHRFGQKGNVLITIYQCKSSIDEYIDEILQNKSRTAKELEVKKEVLQRILEKNSK